MAYSIILTVHIVGACVTALIAAYCVAVLWRRDDGMYRSCAQVLGTIAGLEVATGTMLSILSTKVSALSLCANIIVYLSIVLFLEAVLFARMKKIAVRFPAAKALSPIAGSLLAMAGAVVYGF